VFKTWSGVLFDVSKNPKNRSLILILSKRNARKIGIRGLTPNFHPKSIPFFSFQNLNLTCVFAVWATFVFYLPFSGLFFSFTLSILYHFFEKRNFRFDPLF